MADIAEVKLPRITRGDPRTIILSVVDGDGAAVDLSLSTWTSTVRSFPTSSVGVDLVVDESASADGILSLSFSGDKSRLFEDKIVGDIEGSTFGTILYFSASVRADITRGDAEPTGGSVNTIEVVLSGAASSVSSTVQTILLNLAVSQGPAGPTGPAGADSTVAGPTGPAGADSTVAGPTGPAGADSTVAGPAGADSTVAGPTGPAGADSTVAGPAGADSTVAGPAGADSTVAGPAGSDATVDAANVQGAGALMDSELQSVAAVKALNQSVASGASPTFDIANMTLSDAALVVASETNLQAFADAVDHALQKARGTGVAVTYTAAVNSTTFDLSAVDGQIYSDLGFFHIIYAGATGVTVNNLNASSTYVYLDSSSVLQQQTTTPTREDWSRKLFLMRIGVNTSTNQVIAFEYLNNPLGNDSNSLRDIYTFLLDAGVPFKRDQTITGRDADLGFDVSAGTLLEFGGTGDIHNAHIKSFDAVAGASFSLMSRTGIESATETELPLEWDNATTVTALGSTTWVAHRLFRFSSGLFALQRGQGNYANLVLARAGSLLEDFVLNPQLKNATFFGWWFVSSTASNTNQSSLAEFREYTMGVQGGSSSVLAGALLKGNSLNDLLDFAAARANIGTLVQQASAPTGDATVLWFDTDAVAASPSVPPTTESATTYTLAVSDINSYKIMTAAALVTVTIPLFANVEFADGDMVGIFAAGAGGVTVSVTGLSLIGSSPNLTIPQNKSLLLTCADASADTWIIAGGQTA